MNLVNQPEGSRLCGQACIAMIANISIGEAINLIGHSHGTHTKEIIQALKTLGIPCEVNRLTVRRGKDWPERAVVKIPHPEGSGWHWVVLDGFCVYDPQRTSLLPVECLDLPEFRATSFLPIAA